MEWIIAKLGMGAVQYAGMGLVGLIIAWILKRLPNDVIKAKLGAFFYGAWVTCSLGLAKWKFTKRFWNKLIEHWFIDFIDNILVNSIARFVEGLRADNPKE